MSAAETERTIADGLFAIAAAIEALGGSRDQPGHAATEPPMPRQRDFFRKPDPKIRAPLWNVMTNYSGKPIQVPSCGATFVCTGYQETFTVTGAVIDRYYEKRHTVWQDMTIKPSASLYLESGALAFYVSGGREVTVRASGMGVVTAVINDLEVERVPKTGHSSR